ncbi:MAG: hypothetical protein IPG43_14265 [Proteobacteria bacterium]|nr:hypothetical protein [Pseudomonadota bacterium]
MKFLLRILSRSMIPPLLLLACSGFAINATASPYVFTKITDAPFRAASMNNLVEVAYLTDSEIVLSDGTNSISMIAHAAQTLGHSVLAPLPPPDGQGIGLNDLGTVVYHCISDQSCLVRRDGSVAGGIPAQLSSPSINNFDEVPFRRVVLNDPTRSGIGIANPISGIRMVYSELDAVQNGDFHAGGIPDAPAINDKGEVLFGAAFGRNSPSAYYVSDGSNLRQVGPQFGFAPILNIGPDSFEAYGLNNLGTVAGVLTDEGMFSLRSYFADGSSSLVADSSQFVSAFPFGLNDHNEVLFYGHEMSSDPHYWHLPWLEWQ